jgi:ribose transport system permease protein
MKARVRHLSGLGHLPTWIWPLSAAVALWLIGCALSGRVSAELLLTNVTLSTFLGLAALGQMTVVARGAGSFDLSVPYTVTFSAFISATVMDANNTGIAEGIVVGLLAGVVIGLLNGILVVGPGMPPIVATLASGYIAYSAILGLQTARADPAPGLSSLLRAERGGLALVVPIACFAWLVVAILVRRTQFGLDLHAMGQSQRAAYLAGVRIRSISVAAFALSGLLGGLAGVLLAGYDGGVFTDMANTYLIGSMAAVVVGGTSVEGGVTGVLATVFGALVMTMLVTVLVISHASIGVQDVAEGAIIVLVVGLSRVAHQGAYKLN